VLPLQLHGQERAGLERLNENQPDALPAHLVDDRALALKSWPGRDAHQQKAPAAARLGVALAVNESRAGLGAGRVRGS
jgi:hypothetical protein